MNLFYQPDIPNGTNVLDSEESRHCIKVLRHRLGDSIDITDGRGKFYKAIVSNASPTACAFQIEQTIVVPARPFSIHIAIAPTKNAERLEWFVEKAVEFGVDQITLMECKNSERTYQKLDRLHKIAVSAMKQSLKAKMPVISPLTTFQEVIKAGVEDQRFIAYVDSSNPVSLHNAARKNTSYRVLIGPEGDFNSEELATAVASGFVKVNLGESRLRTETAGIAACHILNLVNN